MQADDGQRFYEDLQLCTPRRRPVQSIRRGDQLLNGMVHTSLKKELIPEETLFRILTQHDFDLKKASNPQFGYSFCWSVEVVAYVDPDGGSIVVKGDENYFLLDIDGNKLPPRVHFTPNNQLRNQILAGDVTASMVRAYFGVTSMDRQHPQNRFMDQPHLTFKYYLKDGLE